MSSKPEAGVADVVAFRDAAEFEAWLAEHLDWKLGVWLKIAKKGSSVASLTDDEAVDLGLCYGWISSQRKAYDGVYYLQKYVPRRPRSRWSQVNVRKVEALIAAGRMQPSGLAEVDAARPPWKHAVPSVDEHRSAATPPRLGVGGLRDPLAPLPVSWAVVGYVVVSWSFIPIAVGQ